MTRIEWRDLSDDELQARLIQRGVHPSQAIVAVDRRNDENGNWPGFIEQVLRP